MKSDQLVSVLMSIYKESVSVVSQAIDSIREQTYQNIEIVVLLDYPEHESMKAYLVRLAAEEPRLRFYVNEKNLGLLYSLNKGVDLCKGDFICRMDEDDYAEKERISRQMKYLQEHSLDLVGSYTNLMDMKGELLGVVRRFPSDHKYLCKYLLYTNAVPHPTWLVRKEVYIKLNGYRDIPCADDYDFLIRVCLNGYRMGVIPEALLRYRINQKGMTQQNIASQKIVSPYLALQIRQNRIFTEQEIADYRSSHKRAENQLMKYYAAGKRWKMGEKLPLLERCRVIFNRHNFVEIRQRLACRWILYRDGKYGHNQDAGRIG